MNPIAHIKNFTYNGLNYSSKNRSYLELNFSQVPATIHAYAWPS